MPLLSTTSSRDNWQRLVEAVLKREQYLQLCRLPSISTIASTRNSSFSDHFSDLHSVSASQSPHFTQVSDPLDKWSVSDPVATVTLQTESDFLEVVYTWGRVAYDMVGKMMQEEAGVLLPTPLQCSATMDVHYVACGFRHSALVTREGKLFTWGHESGGELGHGVNVTQPRLLESLSSVSVGSVACGEFHTCAITVDGELYTWGDGLHIAGLLGHETDRSHWIPKRVLGPLEGLQVAKIACGPWHTALITSAGQLFTFGDGTWGSLGHGNRQDILYPREVESLKGLRTEAVACGLWHTAAIVNVSNTPSCGKLFTWGDGDHKRLGHGNKINELIPTCVAPVAHLDFHKVACGHSMTVGLTTTGRVITIGSPVYGQLGNPLSNGDRFSLVEGKLSGESVEEISCGLFHVAVLTSRNEVYTWGRGKHGCLGHGDLDDRNVPTLVGGLKDKHVKNIACGSDYSIAVCLEKEKKVFVAEESHCSDCRQPFGFRRKRHNCYNCGGVYCHGCSSRKAIGAVRAPDPSKSYRVCRSCYAELRKEAEAGFSKDQEKLSSIRWFDSAAEEQILMPSKQGPSLSVTPFSSERVLDDLKKSNELLSREVVNLRMQVESLKNQCHLQKLELQKPASKVQELMEPRIFLV